MHIDCCFNFLDSSGRQKHAPNKMKKQRAPWLCLGYCATSHTVAIAAHTDDAASHTETVAAHAEDTTARTLVTAAHVASAAPPHRGHINPHRQCSSLRRGFSSPQDAFRAYCSSS